jgi:GAF domain-containing protein
MPYRSIEDPTTLRRILDALLLIEGDLDLSVLLRHVVDEARSMTGARYGALGVLNADRSTLAEFITVGLGPDEVAQIGSGSSSPNPLLCGWLASTLMRRVTAFPSAIPR